MVVNTRQKIAYLLLMSGFGGVIGGLTGFAVLPTLLPMTTLGGATLLGSVAVVSAPNRS